MPVSGRATLAAAALAALLQAAPGQVAVPADGADSCPCATAAELGNQVVPGYPPDYGIDCRPHDLNRSGCVGQANAPKWCNQSWCFVRRGCAVSTFENEAFPGRLASYSTCGYLSAISSALVGSRLRGAPVRVALLTNTGGWLGSFCRGPDNCGGPTFQFWMQVLQAAGANITVSFMFTAGTWAGPGGVPFPSQVLRQMQADGQSTASTFTACVYAAGMGYVDLCVAALTMTPQRRQLSTTVETHSEVYILIAATPAVKEPPILKTILTCFGVFHWTLWVAVVGCTVFMSWLLAWHEGHSYVGEESGMFAGMSRLERLEISTYVGIHSLLNGNAFSPGNRAARTVSVGLSLFILLSITCYTANLASYLVTANVPVTSLSGLNEAIARNMFICLTNSTADFVMANVGVPPRLAVRLPGKTDVIAGLVSGRCDAAIETEDVLEAARAAGECSIMKVGDALLNNDAGAATSERVFRTLELYVNQLKAAGVWQNELQASRPRDVCAALQNSSTKQMTVEAFLGPIILSAFLCAVSLVLQFGRCAHHRRLWSSLLELVGIRRRPAKQMDPGEQTCQPPDPQGSSSVAVSPRHLGLHQHHRLPDRVVVRIPADQLFPQAGGPFLQAHAHHPTIEIQVVGELHGSFARRASVAAEGSTAPEASVITLP